VAITAACSASSHTFAFSDVLKGDGLEIGSGVNEVKAPSSPPVLVELVLPGASSATRPVVARLVKCAESIPHESVCLGVHLPRHPADADALELSAETARDFV
jgi:hypothetical protein